MYRRALGAVAIIGVTAVAFLVPPRSGAAPADTSPEPGQTVVQRFPPPSGCQRVAVPAGSYGEYLRRFPLKPPGSLVHDHAGRVVDWGAELGAVLDVDLITTPRHADLQQCADLAIRLWAEYRWAAREVDDLAFTLQNGQAVAWRDWRAGTRYVVRGNRHVTRRARPDRSAASFREYLAYVMTWLGSAGLKAYAAPVERSQATVGDLFVQNHTGAIGHASILIDRCDRGGERLYLVAESFMPAQEGHVMLPAPGEGEGAWFTLDGLQRHLSQFGTGVVRRLR